MKIFMMEMIALLLTAAAAIAAAQQRSNVEALDGVDPVLLVQGREVSGKPGLKVVHGGFEYLFSTPETKAAFELEPKRYEIQMSGLCARMGKTAGGNPANYVVYEGKIYVFGSDECRKAFVAAPQRYLPRPSAPMPDSPGARKRGKALVERAARGIGMLDALTTYVETASQIQKRPEGDVPLSTKTIWRFPSDVRSERTMTRQGRTMSSATLMTAEGAWFLAQGRAYPTAPAGRPSLEQDFGRHPVALLRSRHDADFTAVALPAGEVDGVRVDTVRVKKGGLDVTLALRADTGQLHSMTFMDRNADGEYGTFRLLYSDFRPTGGLTLPFSIHALFNGTAEPSQSWTIESAIPNAPLDGTLFQPASAPGK